MGRALGVLIEVNLDILEDNLKMLIGTDLQSGRGQGAAAVGEGLL